MTNISASYFFLLNNKLAVLITTKEQEHNNKSNNSVFINVQLQNRYTQFQKHQRKSPEKI